MKIIWIFIASKTYTVNALLLSFYYVMRNRFMKALENNRKSAIEWGRSEGEKSTKYENKLCLLHNVV